MLYTIETDLGHAASSQQAWCLQQQLTTVLQHVTMHVFSMMPLVSLGYIAAM